jgi:hypothetical protein
MGFSRCGGCEQCDYEAGEMYNLDEHKRIETLGLQMMATSLSLVTFVLNKCELIKYFRITGKYIINMSYYCFILQEIC